MATSFRDFVQILYAGVRILRVPEPLIRHALTTNYNKLTIIIDLRVPLEPVREPETTENR